MERGRERKRKRWGSAEEGWREVGRERERVGAASERGQHLLLLFLLFSVCDDIADVLVVNVAGHIWREGGPQEHLLCHHTRRREGRGVRDAALSLKPPQLSLFLSLPLSIPPQHSPISFSLSLFTSPAWSCQRPRIPPPQSPRPTPEKFALFYCLLA